MAKSKSRSIGFGSPASEQAQKGPEQADKPFDPSIGKDTQFKAGQSGNPGGRPKKKPFTYAIARRIDATPQEIDEAVDHLMELAKGNVGFCEGGPAVSAFKLLKETIEGKAVQPVSGPDGGPIEYREMSDAALDARIKQLLGETGTRRTAGRKGAKAGTEAAEQQPS